jgi:hypothetical protein
MPLPNASLKGQYFTTGDKTFLPIGAHWVPAKAAMQWPYQWNEQELEADFAKMRDLGFNTVRFDLVWAWFEPRPGYYNPEAFKQLDFFIKMAHKYSIYLHPTLFVGGEVGEAYWDVPWRHGRHPHADPEMLHLETNHAAELARRYQGEPAILAWDLTDEPPFWIVVGKTNDAMAINWTRLIAGALRRYDPQHALCVGTSQEDLSGGPFRPDNLASEVDFFTAHPYSIYALHLFPDPMLSERGTYCGAFQVALSSGAGRPVMIHELGASAAQYNLERIAAFDRVTMYSGLGAGTNGFLLWCFTDAAPSEFQTAPYLRAPHETQFGITDWKRQDRPAGRELRQFSRLLAQMDMNGILPSAGDAALIIPFDWSKPEGDYSRLGLTGPNFVPYVSTQESGSAMNTANEIDSQVNYWLLGSLLSSFILARRAGLKADLPREYSDWSKYPLLLLPSPLTSTERNAAHVHTSFWDRARAYVKNGGALYASLCADAAIPEMQDLFGASLADHVAAPEVTITLTADFGDLKAGESFHYQPDFTNPKHWPATVDLCGGQVIATDQDGRPALIAHTYGAGKTLLCTYPIESYLALRPSAFETPENTDRLYRAFRLWAGVEPAFHTDQPAVEATTLCGDQRGYVVLTNHSSADHEVTLSVPEGVKDLARITPTGAEPLAFQNGACQIRVENYSGEIIAWRR